MTIARINRDLESEIGGALQFGAEVAIKLKEDYGLTIGAYRASVWRVLADEWEARVDTAHAAFVLANHIQTQWFKEHA